jgi:hypothetical protein
MKGVIYIIIFSIFVSSNLHALEVDEKLTIRFLKVSTSKKTILVNRGAEDGLSVGNHAKFFTTSGVIARGVVEKVSPSRSIWSLYRIIDPYEITNDKVLNLKIGTPVKISEDASKSIIQDSAPQRVEPINAPLAHNINPELDSLESDSFESDSFNTEKPAPSKDSLESDSFDLETPVDKIKSYKPSKAKMDNGMRDQIISNEQEWEVWGNASASMLSGSMTNTNLATVAASSQSTSSMSDFSLGIEKYFFQTASVFNQVSLTAFYHRRNANFGQDIQASESVSEYGGGIRYHFDQSASLINSIMPFVLADIGVGSVNIQSKVISGAVVPESANGTSKFYSLGGGAKYILGNGIGFRSLIDYYSSTETFIYTGYTGTRTLTGFRLQVGLSYRFN